MVDSVVETKEQDDLFQTLWDRFAAQNEDPDDIISEFGLDTNDELLRQYGIWRLKRGAIKEYKEHLSNPAITNLKRLTIDDLASQPLEIVGAGKHGQIILRQREGDGLSPSIIKMDRRHLPKQLIPLIKQSNLDELGLKELEVNTSPYEKEVPEINLCNLTREAIAFANGAKILPSHVVAPTGLIEYDGKIIGYTRPFISGTPLPYGFAPPDETGKAVVGTDILERAVGLLYENGIEVDTFQESENVIWPDDPEKRAEFQFIDLSLSSW
jgi:hypothetical protein